MIRAITPNKAIVFAVSAFIAYWIAAIFVPGVILRDVFNSIAFGSAIIITVTWATSAARALKEGADTGEWQIILGIFLVWFIVLAQRVYVITFNYMGRPESWASSPIAGFWPYSFMIAGLLFITAPDVREGRLGKRAIWSMVLAVAIGSLVAGILIGASISTGG